MKLVTKYIVLLLLTLTGLSTSAQQLNEDTTTNRPFFKATKFNSRCYVGLDGSAIQILKTQVGGNFGVNLNWVINHKFVVYVVYDGLTSQNQIQKLVNSTEVTPIYLIHRYVGMGFSYILFNNKLFSLQPGLSDGWGHIQYKSDNLTYKKDFWEILPAISATYNCTKYFRVGLGIDYHIAVAAGLNGLKNGDISGVGGVVFIKVGTF